MSSSCVQLSFELAGLDAGFAERACLLCGASSVTLLDARDDPVLEPLPGEVRLWPTTRLQALFAAAADPERLRAALSAVLRLPAERIHIQCLENRIWEREWLRDFHAMRFGRRLWVCPHHEHVPDSDAVVVKLDPGLAFGTGTHPTTALCLEWLDGHPPRDLRIIDYGCGSGILAIAAVKLGARQAYCFDIDPQALLAANDNAAANQVESRITVCRSEDALVDGADLLVANILSGPLCALARSFGRLVHRGGSIVLAGLLREEAIDVTQAYGPWFDMRPFGDRDGWVGLCGSRHDRTPDTQPI